MPEPPHRRKAGRFFGTLPVVVALVSLLSLINCLSEINGLFAVPGILTSLTGLAGTALYFRNRQQRRSVHLAYTIFAVWAAAQAPYLVYSEPATGHAVGWDATQCFRLLLGFGFSLKGGSSLELRYNALNLLWTWWLHRLRQLE
ncbi:hypothetical protein K3G63_07315 [Hymenobacter sp. HSC-4F20]|uniref:hypothetical protein n=1 Tax=Hymenobacter sp. HSC-4F20 TaxID=2864135 RepID=UPI001C72C142|nr:hypothetical protein [Hymenobacter sp. HSC-4F20]MBX0290242.1 hypothetical protein [Hymenobacter sp. HSC-4F20]